MAEGHSKQSQWQAKGFQLWHGKLKGSGVSAQSICLCGCECDGDGECVGYDTTTNECARTEQTTTIEDENEERGASSEERG